MLGSRPAVLYGFVLLRTDARTVLSAWRPVASAPFAFTDCPSCSAALDRDLTYRVVIARGDNGQSHNALVFACGVCGQFLGVGPA